MTVICYKDGIIAADSAIWRGDDLSGYIDKIGSLKVSGGTALFGACGDMSEIQHFLEWCRNGRQGDLFADKKERDFSGIYIEPTGAIVQYEHDGGICRFPSGTFTAVGSGHRMAFGAMAAGASAIKAVQIAIKRHAYCGGPVRSFRHRVRRGS